MLASSNLELLCSPALREVPGTMSHRIDVMLNSPSDGAPACVQVPADALAAEDAPAAELVRREVELGNPYARYEELCLEGAEGETAAARLIVARGPFAQRGPRRLMLMFHDAGRPVRGWHHMTRFVALGCDVLAFDMGKLSVDEATDGLARFSREALRLTRAALGLDDISRDELCIWADGFGASLALRVAAGLDRPIGRAVFASPLFARDPHAPAQGSPEPLAPFARDVLVGSGLRDEQARTEDALAFARAIPGRARLVAYPEHAHERINEFENEAMRFLALS